MSEEVSNVAGAGISRRTVVKAAAWAAPVVAVAVAVPNVAASVDPPVATNVGVDQTGNPNLGSNLSVRYNGQSWDQGEGEYVNGAAIPTGSTLTITLSNGATADSYSNLEGLILVSGTIAAGPLVFSVVGTPTTVRVRLNNISPVGGQINSVISGPGVSGSAGSIIN